MSRLYLQVRLTPEQEEMKRYLQGKGVNISDRIRTFLVQLYGFEKNKEVVNNNSPS
nr:MAG TPA: antitoxin [Caudoviricetes sp.]